MSWLNTILTAIATAAIGTVVGGYFAGLAVRWYRVSGFEGGSGYFVVGLAICGLVAGLVIGVIVSRIVAASANAGLLVAMLYSAGLILTLEGAAAGTARLLADIPPTIDGETLMLRVEARWPAARADSPANVPGVAYLDLGANTLLRQQEPKRGALWKEDAQKIDGQWTVFGAAPMSTTRGTPVLAIALSDSERTSVTLPSFSRRTVNDSAWSAWFPANDKDASRTSGLTYRFRVQKLSVPVRIERIGNFVVGAVVSYFKPVSTDGMSTLDFYGSFLVSFSDKPLVGDPAVSQAPGNSFRAPHDSVTLAASSVAQLPGTRPTLLAGLFSSDSGAYWAVLTDEGETIREQRVAGGSRDGTPLELTNIAERMAETREPHDPRGRVDRTTFARSTMLLFEHAVLNVETHDVHPFSAVSKASIIPSVPPLGVSPDAHSFVRFGSGEINSSLEFPPLLIVTDFVRDTVYELPIDRSRMRYGVLNDLDTEWLAHHFVWKRGAYGDRLEARTDFVPIAYHGVLLPDSNNPSDYEFSSGGQPARQALSDFLKAEFHATGDTSDENSYAWILLIGNDSIKLETPGDRSSTLRLSCVDGSRGSDLVMRIGKAFNAALQTGKYDKAFSQP